MAFGYNIDIRKTNKRNHIIDIFRHNGALSKVQAKQLSGYSMDTILNVFDSLIEEKLIIETTGTQKPKGRKATYFELNTNSHLYLGITFNLNGIYSSLISFTNQTIESHTTILELNLDLERFLTCFKQHIEEFKEKISDNIENIKAIGCSVPGIVQPDTGILHNYVMMQYIHDLDIKAILHQYYPQNEIFVEHNIKSMSSYFLAQRDLILKYPRIFYISVRSGVASGIISNGQLVTSHGEFGHVRVSDSGDPCICGRTGCLDVYFSYRSIVEAASQFMDNGPFLPDIMHVVEEYDKNPDIRKLLDDRFRYFARAVHDAVNVIDPDLVLISGKTLAAFQDPVARLREEIRKEYTPAGFVDTIENTEIQFHDLGPEISAQGICYYLIKQDWDYVEETALDN